MPIAVVTGGSKGLGRALVAELLARGWSVVTDARDARALAEAHGRPPGSSGTLMAIAGDVADAAHRDALVGAARRLGGLDLLVNNASTLGPSPMPELSRYPLEAFRRAYEVNVVAPLGLIQSALGLLQDSENPRIVNLTSDASVAAYEGWGGYGSSKAALDHLSAVLALEEPELRVWALDPGDMRTQMHQDAFPGEDIGDRPPPEAVVPAVMALIESDRPSARLRAFEVASR